MTIYYKIFGFGDWYGRVISWIFGIIGLVSLYNWTDLIFDRTTAITSSMLYSASITFQYARKSMPDVFALSLVLLGLLLLTKYLLNGKMKYYYWGY